MSDALLSPNRYLCEKYCDRTAGRRGAVVGFCVTDKEFADIPADPGDLGDTAIVKLVYAAGRHHVKEAQKTLVPLLKRLDECYSDKISMTFVGVKPDIDPEEFHFNIRFVDGMPLEEYRAWMREQHFDIGFAPLDGTRFDKMKCFVKYIEYTLVGVTGIYSRCEPYTFVVEDGKDGFMAEDADEWYEKTTALIDDKKLRKNLLTTAVEKLKMRYSQEAVYNELKEKLPEMFEAKRLHTPCSALWLTKVCYYVSIIFDCIFLAGVYLKRTGLRATIKRTIEHFTIKKRYIEK